MPPDLKLERANLGAHLVAGATFAIGNEPKGMASAGLAGVDPVAGCYALTVAMPVGLLPGPSEQRPAPGRVCLQIALVTILPVSPGWLFAGVVPVILRRRAPFPPRPSKLLLAAFALVV